MSGPIAVDARWLAAGPSGDRTYLLGLLEALWALDPAQPYLLCYDAAPGEGLEGVEVPAAVTTQHFGAKPGWLWTPLAWPRVLRQARAAVAHAAYLVPPLAPCPTVATVHDVSFLTHPEWFPPRQLKVMRTLIPLSARRATRIVTGSAHAAGEIAAHLRIPRERIVVIPYAAAERFRPQDAEAAQATAARYGLDGPYLLAVGLLQPRKNLGRLIEAFARLAPRHPALKLAVVGRSGWQAEAVAERLAAEGLTDRAVLTGPVPDGDLPALYAAAAVMVYPSLYEGFGLPPLEAMACGAPVVASNTSSLPEVVGDGGLLVDPTDVGAITAAIERVLTEPGLREVLVQRGLAQAARFSWRRCAEAHRALFAELTSGR